MRVYVLSVCVTASHNHNLGTIVYKSAFTSVTVCTTHSAYECAAVQHAKQLCLELNYLGGCCPVFGHAGHVKLHSNASG